MAERKRLVESAASLKNLTMRYFMEAHAAAARGKPVVWIAIIVPIEILKGFDAVVAVPENHAAMCAARGLGATQAEKAERAGYSMDLCSYARIDLGTWFDGGGGSPSLGLPKPDLLISNNNNCSLLVKWFDVYRRELGVPHFTLDVPFCYGPRSEADTEYIVSQFQDLITTIEKLTGQKYNPEKTAEAVRLTNEASRHWKRFLSFAAQRPAGITAFDSFVHMAPYITSFRGTEEMVAHMRLLADETEELVKKGDYPVPNERYRLLWDNIAPWHQLRNMSERLSALDANVMYATYTSCIGTIEGGVDLYEYDGGDPLRYLARIQNFSVCPYGLNLRYRAMGEMIKKFGIDGVVFASNRSCKVYSVMQMDLMRRVEDELGIPSVMIEVDHADARKYSEEGAFTRIEALLERIGA
ncbi:MAG: 2-hydroxyacyl-CoA dehydratase family protein [Smithellaceae bacterium]|nr:2-hydroxyacyl-CoA dehydratase family protein [Smithellaceae bacterium]